MCVFGCSKTDRIRVRAVLGNADAEAALADMYYRGEGRPKDLTEAARWLQRAAEQGNAAAQYNLGTMYANGEGVPRDASQAAKWYRAAAKQDDDDAENELGRMYWTGDGVPRDLTLAAVWSQKAAEQGNRIAQFRLGLMYMGGRESRRTASRRTSGSSLAPPPATKKPERFLHRWRQSSRARSWPRRRGLLESGAGNTPTDGNEDSGGWPYGSAECQRPWRLQARSQRMCVMPSPACRTVFVSA